MDNRFQSHPAPVSSEESASIPCHIIQDPGSQLVLVGTRQFTVGGVLCTLITGAATIDMIAPTHLGIVGPVFRSGPNELSFKSPQILRDIYVANQDVTDKPDI
ncbi:hypothetical protein N7471_010410 [Penicillium samsonianum]|uniref:uncharacterized protein n=1 Tax=Penicillium samsonianum TaxID=1882272 RepID=UPI002548FFF8|nr:uncharacterized protein N7471_010410 [Penicillium samsonianum]KAJ6125917.1 hypothetical protein N7471_010410 [Penicillium samsonianum]